MRSVEEVVSPFLRQMRPSGSEGIRATCPICSHKRTFLLSVSRGTFICFSCQNKGGLPRLLSLLGLGREEIDHRLKGVSLEKPKGFVVAKQSNVLPEYVLGAFEVFPKPLLRLGFSEEIIKKHDVGFDRNKCRITFPIRDFLGRLIAVSGRAYPDGVSPRYLVYHHDFTGIVPSYTPENRAHLYGIDSVYSSKYMNPDNEDPVILVEGYKACLWMRQHGFENTVALQGSTMSLGQETMLARLRGKKIVFLDNEAGKSYPGKNGRCDAIRIASRLRRHSPTRVCVYPEQYGERTSPDDLNKRALMQIIQNSKQPSQLIIGKKNGF